MAQDPMTTAQARDYIPQWGSMMRAGDPGAVAYGAIPPNNVETRDSLVEYLTERKSIAESNDVTQLERAIAYLATLDYSARLEIEICPREPRASAYLVPGGCEIPRDSVIGQDMLDCTGGGDCEPACDYVLTEHKPRFVIVARDGKGGYVNREATDGEIAATARAIYFDSDSDFTGDTDLARVYLIWEAAHYMESSDPA